MNECDLSVISWSQYSTRLLQSCKLYCVAPVWIVIHSCVCFFKEVVAYWTYSPWGQAVCYCPAGSLGQHLGRVSLEEQTSVSCRCGKLFQCGVCAHTEAGVCEPGCIGIQIYVLHRDWHSGTRPLRHTDTHQGVLLMRDQHHLKDTQGTGQGEIKRLQGTAVSLFPFLSKINPSVYVTITLIIRQKLTWAVDDDHKHLSFY